VNVHHYFEGPFTQSYSSRENRINPTFVVLGTSHVGYDKFTNICHIVYTYPISDFHQKNSVITCYFFCIDG
jgi:hypothetical protein